MVTKLTAVTIRTWNRSRTWFMELPVVDGKVHVPQSTINSMLQDWGLPRGATISIG